MIEYRYFNRLTRENKKKIIINMSTDIKTLLDAEVYLMLTEEYHLEICDLLRKQKREINDK